MSAPPFDRHHYLTRYDNLPRFISYYYQITLARELNPKTVLEVGVGNQTVSSYLKRCGYEVVTCDLNPDLQPDQVGDVRALPFPDDRFDLVMCCEVLEHIPWEEVETALDELYRVSRRYVLISVPYMGWFFVGVFRFPFIRRLLRREYLDCTLRLPIVHPRLALGTDHHWELGRLGRSRRRFRRLLRKRFRIRRELYPPLNPYHQFYVLEKKGA